MSTYGADVEQLRGTASAFGKAADTLDSLARGLGDQLARTPWKGPDSERFRSDWDTDHTAQLRAVTASLRDAANALRTNADDQEQTSSVDGGSPKTGGPLPYFGPGGPFGPGPLHPPGTATTPTTTDAPAAPAAAPKMPDNDLGGKWETHVGAYGEHEKTTPHGSWTVQRSSEHGAGAKLGAKWDAGVTNGNDIASWDGDHEYASKSWGDDVDPNENGAHIGGSASVTAGVWANGSTAISNGTVSGSAEFNAMAGGRADVGAQASVGENGVQVTAGGHAFVGGEFGGKVGIDAGGVGGSLGASAQVGFGAEADLTAKISLDEVKIGGTAGASFLLGAKIHPEIEIKPREIGHNIMKLLHL